MISFDNIYKSYGTKNTSCFDKYGKDKKEAYFKQYLVNCTFNRLKINELR